MKKFCTAFLCAILLLVSLSACGEKATTEQPAEQPIPDYQPESVSKEIAAELNAKISSDNINLVQFRQPAPGTEIAVIKTNYGELRAVLFRDQAPLAVENFVTHANNGYFNGMTFYRVVNQFVIESGKPADGDAVSIYKDNAGNPVPFKDEFSLDLWNFRGALIMQNAGQGNSGSNTSEFIIVQARGISQAIFDEMVAMNYPKIVLEKYKEVGGVPGFDWRHTVFGQLTSESFEVLDQLAAAEVDESFQPKSTILIEEVRIETL